MMSKKVVSLSYTLTSALLSNRLKAHISVELKQTFCDLSASSLPSTASCF